MCNKFPDFLKGMIVAFKNMKLKEEAIAKKVGREREEVVEFVKYCVEKMGKVGSLTKK